MALKNCAGRVSKELRHERVAFTHLGEVAGNVVAIEWSASSCQYVELAGAGVSHTGDRRQ